MRRTFFLAAALMIATPTVTFALDPAMIAQGQVLSGMARGYAERGYAERRGVRSRRAEPRRAEPSEARTRQTCANGRAMARSGNRDPRLRYLLALCRGGGW